MRGALVLLLGAVLGGTTACAKSSDDFDDFQAPREFSGIAWLQTEGVEQEVFLVAHDTRDNEEKGDLPRLSIVKTQLDSHGIQVQQLTDLEFPTTPNDLESIARLPDRNAALLAESNDDGSDPDLKIYLAEWSDDLEFEITGSTP